MSNHDDAHDAEPGGLSRRGAIKAGAAIAVGATVWAEPTIKGLAKRPAYAAGTSADPEIFTMLTDMGEAPVVTGNGNSESASVTGDNGSTMSITRTGSPNSGTLTFDAGAAGGLTGSISINGAPSITVTGNNPFAVSSVGPANLTITGSITCGPATP